MQNNSCFFFHASQIHFQMKGIARRLVLKKRFHGKGLSTSSSSLLAFEQNPLLTSKVNNKFIDEQKKSDDSLLAKIEAIVFLGGRGVRGGSRLSKGSSRHHLNPPHNEEVDLGVSRVVFLNEVLRYSVLLILLRITVRKNSHTSEPK